MRSAKALLLLAALTLVAACGNMADDLAPSGSDKRPAAQAGTLGYLPGQTAADFTLQDTAGGSVTLAGALTGKKGAVIYFTMWCPICLAHMDLLRSEIIPANPDVAFLVLDYVSGGVTGTLEAQSSSGYLGAPFTVLTDDGARVADGLEATMGTVILVDENRKIRMNEDFKEGTRLKEKLAVL